MDLRPYVFACLLLRGCSQNLRVTPRLVPPLQAPRQSAASAVSKLPDYVLARTAGSARRQGVAGAPVRWAAPATATLFIEPGASSNYEPFIGLRDVKVGAMQMPNMPVVPLVAPLLVAACVGAVVCLLRSFSTQLAREGLLTPAAVPGDNLLLQLATLKRHAEDSAVDSKLPCALPVTDTTTDAIAGACVPAKSLAALTDDGQTFALARTDSAILEESIWPSSAVLVGEPRSTEGRSLAALQASRKQQMALTLKSCIVRSAGPLRLARGAPPRCLRGASFSLGRLALSSRRVLRRCGKCQGARNWDRRSAAPVAAVASDVTMPRSWQRFSPGDDEDVDDDGPEEMDVFGVAETPKERLDVLLFERYGKPRSYFQNLIARGAVRVNGSVMLKKSFRKLRKGDDVSVRFLVDERALPLSAEPIPLNVLHEDDDLIIVNKPAGLVVHPAPGNWSGTLVNAVLHHLESSRRQDREGNYAAEDLLPEAPPGPESRHRPGIVHRLDVGTSGVIAVTKNSEAFDAVSQQFARREVSKTYLAVCRGTRRIFRGHKHGGGHYIQLPLGRSLYDRKRMAVLEEECGGRASTSRVRALAEREDQTLSLLEVTPTTGRTHQIRVHLAESEVPVLGDTTYGPSVITRQRRRFGVTRPMLHAHKLAFAHPRTGERMEFISPLPEDMRQVALPMVPMEGEGHHVAQLLGSDTVVDGDNAASIPRSAVAVDAPQV